MKTGFRYMRYALSALALGSLCASNPRMLMDTVNSIVSFGMGLN